MVLWSMDAPSFSRDFFFPEFLLLYSLSIPDFVASFAAFEELICMLWCKDFPKDSHTIIITMWKYPCRDRRGGGGEIVLSDAFLVAIFSHCRVIFPNGQQQLPISFVNLCCLLASLWKITASPVELWDCNGIHCVIFI